MNSEEKEITYQTSNSYSTLNQLTERTKNVWFVCHGMGYLSRYFLKYFKELKKKYKTPKHPWQKDRIDKEKEN